MQIHELKVKPKKNRKRIGRGGKRGTYSGKGNKGQKARSGGNVDPLFQGGSTSLLERLKKVRGFKAITPKKNIFKLGQIDKFFANDEVISQKTLVEKGIFRKSEIKNGVKILASGEFKNKVVIAKDILVSGAAVEAIGKMGGKIETADEVVKKETKKKVK
ncbi:MAG: 50S ribosomal protein L15 [Candidatus Moraniibacteriota bacterium]